MGKFAWGSKAKLKTLLGPLSTNFWKHQCFFAFTPQPNFSTKNLKFHWRWWDQIQSIFLHLFYFNIQNGTPRFANFWTTRSRNTFPLVKVSKSQNKFMKSSFFPKNERNIARISALNVRKGDFINLFWDLLTFSYPTQQKYCRLSAVFLQLNL